MPPPPRNSPKKLALVPPKKPPSITLVGVACYFFAFILGVFLASLYFAFKPVITVPEVPQDPKSGAIYLVKTPSSLRASKIWLKKRKVFLSEKPFLSPIPIRDYDLNLWVKRTFTQGISASSEGLVKKGSSGSLEGFYKNFSKKLLCFQRRGVPYFRLEGDELHIAQKLDVYILGVYGKMTLQVEGAFAKNGEDAPYRYRPHNLRIGSAHFMDKLKIPDIMFYKVLMPMFEGDAEFGKVQAVWGLIDTLKIEEGVMYIRKRA